MNYENYETAQGWEEKAFGLFSLEQAAYYSAELQRHGLTNLKNLHVLDVGFGNGSFLGWCRSRGWQCDGLEVNDKLIARAKSHGYSASQTVSELPANTQQRYDLITAFDVLEHIDREFLVTFLASFKEVSTPKTLFVLRFPNGDNPFSMPVQNGDVTHKTAIGQAMLRQIAQLANLEVIALSGPSQPLKGARLVRRISVVIGWPLRWVIGIMIKHLFMGGVPVTFSPNLLAVLRKQASSPT